MGLNYRSRECDKCQTTRYSDKYCEKCISLYLQSLFNTWTSGNKIIDDFIHQCQILSSLPTCILEWIPFDQFEEVEKLTEGGFSSIYTVTWTRGYLCDYDENKKEFAYFGSQLVVLKFKYLFNYSILFGSKRICNIHSGLRHIQSLCNIDSSHQIVVNFHIHSSTQFLLE